MKKKTFSVLATVAVAASLVVAPMVSAGAVASDALIGEEGVMVPFTPESNSPKYWEKHTDHPSTCYSSEGNTDHGSITNDGKTVTLNPYQDSWPGDHWELLVIKAGNTNNVIDHPDAGVAYASPRNPAGNQANVSHWIVCKGTTPPTTEPKTVTPSLTYSDPTCAAAGTVLESTGTGVSWTSVLNPDGSTTWTAAPATGFVFPQGVKTTWTVPGKLPLDSDECRPAKPADKVTSVDTVTSDCIDYEVTIETVTTTTTYSWNGTEWVAGVPTDVKTTTTRAMTVEEKLQCPVPESTVEYRAWVDGDWDCGDTEVTQTREVVTTTYGRDAEGNPTALSSLVTEDRTRQLTQDEIGECPLIPGEIASTCQGDVPYLGYEVTLPEGFVPDSESPVTITFVNTQGEDYVVTGQPLSGALLWPGAQATEPKMWPGWDLVNGTYVETDGNYAWTRDGVTVRFDVNPTFSTTVHYPATTELCANPPKQAISPEGPSDEEDPGTPGSTPNDPEEALASTGGVVSPVLPIAGGAALLLGLAALLTVLYQRRRATS